MVCLNLKLINQNQIDINKNSIIQQLLFLKWSNKYNVQDSKFQAKLKWN